MDSPALPTKTGQFARFFYREGKRCFSILGKARFQTHGHSLFLPVEFRRDEQVPPKAFVRMGVNELPVFGVVLDPRAHATPKILRVARIGPVMPRTHGCKINEPATIRLLRGEDMVIKRPLDKIRNGG